VIDDPAFAAGIVIGGPKTTPGVIFGVGPQPGTQRRIRISRGVRHRLVSLGATVLPGHPAGEPLTDPQHPLQVVYGRPPAFRA